MKIGLIAHCNFRGNSAMHVFSVAAELQKFGHECCMLVPDSPETVHDHDTPSFNVIDYASALKNGLSFTDDGARPDILHAWSPREHVRKITQALVKQFDCPYVVHMEDNEEQIVQDELSELDYSELRLLPDGLVDGLITPYRSHPRRYKDFIERADGFSCLVDRLMEFKPQSVPGVVFWPGFDARFAHITEEDRITGRTRFGLAQDDIVLLYSGNVHLSIVGDLQRLYAAAGLLRKRGLPIKLVRSGLTQADIGIDHRHGTKEYLVELGFVSRKDVPILVAMSDILVQPGKSDAFNDYRFPSKLPEYLVSGRPVILPDSNIGTMLEHGKHALKLESGSIKEITSLIRLLIDSPELRKSLGANSRKFALENLTWAKGANALERLYSGIMAQRKPPVPAKVSAVEPSKNVVPADGAAGKTFAPATFPVKLIAFYLPQFHPIPENDEWWGKGFTEWANVVRGVKNFRYHQQPRLPTELGFYDLRVEETLHKQAELARSHGIHGFCFYYYWFNGKRLLERPLDLWLAERGPRFPFCICWANENWSRRWDGSENEILIAQTYEVEGVLHFINDVMPILKDPRYIRVDGAPLLLVYRVSELKDPVGVAQAWRSAARDNGIEQLHLCAVQSFGIGDPRYYGFDSAIEFSPPHIDRMLVDPMRVHGVHADFEGYLEDYISVAMRSINDQPVDYVRYRGIFPRWDNTARRRSKGHVFINDSPKAYAQWLRFLAREAMVRRNQQEPLIFINAWNEWAEGAYLEPDDGYGRAFLEVTHDALCEGILDHVRGPTPEREREFTRRVSREPTG
jgi:glycosyltransferase involved in cell wall biosynthesis